MARGVEPEQTLMPWPYSTRQNSLKVRLPCPCCGQLRVWESWREDTRTRFEIHCPAA